MTEHDPHTAPEEIVDDHVDVVQDALTAPIETILSGGIVESEPDEDEDEDKK